jgi:hypothetical protein
LVPSPRPLRFRHWVEIWVEIAGTTPG